MPNLADSLACKQFVSKLEHCEAEVLALRPVEAGFIEDLREKFDSREQADDLGITPWNPSKSQNNWLTEIAMRLHYKG